jgi:hypothetical protein
MVRISGNGMDYPSKCRRVAVCSVICFMLFMIAAAAALADDTPVSQGTTLDELRQCNLKAPGTQKMAVLPFFATTGKQVHSDVATATAYLILQREGYQMVPLWDAEKAYKEDKQMEPGAAPRKEDAARVGKTLGADLVCYGEVDELESYVKTSFFSSVKKGKGAMKVSIADTGNGNVVFWNRRSETSGGGGMVAKKASSLERRAARVILGRALENYCQGLPPHQHNPEGEITEDVSLTLEKEWVKHREGTAE